jgi:hypothetical protein
MPTSGDRNDSNKPITQPRTAKQIEEQMKKVQYKK